MRRRDDGKYEPDPDTAPLVVQAIGHLEDGWSLWRTSQWMDARDHTGRTWEPTGLKRLVTSPAIAGGVQTGSLRLDAILVVPVGVAQPTMPTPIG